MNTDNCTIVLVILQKSPVSTNLIIISGGVGEGQGVEHGLVEHNVELNVLSDEAGQVLLADKAHGLVGDIGLSDTHTHTHIQNTRVKPQKQKNITQSEDGKTKERN